MPYDTDHKVGEFVVYIGDDNILNFEHLYKIKGVDKYGNLQLVGDPRPLVYNKDYFVKPKFMLDIISEIANLIKL